MVKAQDYWKHKVSLFLTNPVYKVLLKKEDTNNTEGINKLLGIDKIDHSDSFIIDKIVSGLISTTFCEFYYNKNNNKYFSFTENPIITHPLVKDKKLHCSITGDLNVGKIQDSIIQLLKGDLGFGADKSDVKSGQLYEKYKEKENEEWYEVLYNYLFFAFRKRLRTNNIGNIGSFWDLIPADESFPDHSIWSHCGLTSAIGSSFTADNSVSLSVFSITPVQPFIAKGRKLRDSWVASVILSYLSFIGIRTVMKELGPDHIVYPSLHDQSLVESYLSDEFDLSDFLIEQEEIKKTIDKSKKIASFPNKFVYIIPSKNAEEISRCIEHDVQQEWERIAGFVCSHICKRDSKSEELFMNQISDYWTYSWSSAKLLNLEDKDAFSKILPEKKWAEEFKFIKYLATVIDKNENEAILYGTTHSLIQGLLASAKLKPLKIRKTQSGEKCPLCGEHEVLHDFKAVGMTDAYTYSNKIKEFWDVMRKRFNSSDSFAQIGKNERLCAVCTIKRFLPLVLKKGEYRNELLYEVLSRSESFPSSTELASKGFLNKLRGAGVVTTDEEKQLISSLHLNELEQEHDEQSSLISSIIKKGKDKGITYSDKDKYYAVLLMDGDKMGDLINGETFTSSLSSIVHPDLYDQLKNSSFYTSSSLYKNGFDQKRLINPAVHAVISDALNSFARFGVSPIVEKSGGSLIYAGGDDVCAVMPLETVLITAEEIAKAYTMSFVSYSNDGIKEISSINPGMKKIGLHLGKAEKISISAAIVIAHHKEPLRELFRDAHKVLDDVAKKQKGRNALAIRLKKRSGGDRDIGFKWDALNAFLPGESLLDSFKKLMLNTADSEVSSTLLYRMSQLKEAVCPLCKTKEDIEKNKEKILGLFEYEVTHSGLSIEIHANGEKSQKEAKRNALKEMSARLAGLCIQSESNKEGWFNQDGPIIGRFLASREELRNDIL